VTTDVIEKANDNVCPIKGTLPVRKKQKLFIAVENCSQIRCDRHALDTETYDGEYPGLVGEYLGEAAPGEFGVKAGEVGEYPLPPA